MHCSAFAATGPATEGRQDRLRPHHHVRASTRRHFYNVWLDVKPAKGHRVVMQTFPGGIQSGMDYYINDAGLLVCETTIGQTRFDVKGMPLASRIRKAMQYADRIDKAVAILEKDNNGLYTNEWLLGDTKTNEIAMFELGTHKTQAVAQSARTNGSAAPRASTGAATTPRTSTCGWRRSPAPKDRPAERDVRAVGPRPQMAAAVRAAQGQDRRRFGKLAFTTPPLAAYPSLDAKFTTTDDGEATRNVGPVRPAAGPDAGSRPPEERKRYPEIKPLSFQSVDDPECQQSRPRATFRLSICRN